MAGPERVDEAPPAAGSAFPRHRRLRRRAEFLAVQQGPELRVRVPSFLLLGRWTGAASRVGFVASRRLGGAVVRNRAKRRLRDLVRRAWARLPAGIDLVLVAQDAIRDRPPADLAGDLDRALRDLGRALSRGGGAPVAARPTRR